MEALVIWVAIATIVGTLANVIQVGIAWYTLREIGDLDHDRKDWFEKLPWRHYELPEKAGEGPDQREGPGS